MVKRTTGTQGGKGLAEAQGRAWPFQQRPESCFLQRKLTPADYPHPPLPPQLRERRGKGAQLAPSRPKHLHAAAQGVLGTQLQTPSVRLPVARARAHPLRFFSVSAPQGCSPNAVRRRQACLLRSRAWESRLTLSVLDLLRSCRANAYLCFLKIYGTRGRKNGRSGHFASRTENLESSMSGGRN